MLSVDTNSFRLLPRQSSKNCDLQFDNCDSQPYLRRIIVLIAVLWVEEILNHILCFRPLIKWAFSAVAVISALLMLLVYTPPLQSFRRPIPLSSRISRTPFARLGAIEPRLEKVKKYSNPKKKTTNLSSSKSGDKKIQAPRNVVEHTPLKRNESRIQKQMRILIWMQNPSIGHHQCSTPIPCVFTNDHSLYNESDAVVIDTRNVALLTPIDHLPLFRPPKQHWIGYMRESPARRLKLKGKPYETWLNWTFTYSMNGDVVIPYGMCLPTRDMVAKDPSRITKVIRRVYGKSAESMPWLKRHAKDIYVPQNYAKGRTRLACWLVSNCRTPSLRERYVAELKRHLDITIFGECVGKRINKSDDTEFEDLLKTHKFYLAFENSLCTDYITEKVFKRMRSNVLPIVLGGADYTAHLPPHSYINVKDYSSPKELAKYLHKLDKNDTLYNEYFAWKKYYSCLPGARGITGQCELCRMMNENRNKVNVIPDINTFWSGENNCIPAEDYYKDIASDILGKRILKEYGPQWPSFS